MLPLAYLITLLLCSFVPLAHSAGTVSPAFIPVATNPDLFSITYYWVDGRIGVLPGGVAWPNVSAGVNTTLIFQNTMLTNFLKNIRSAGTRFPTGAIPAAYWNVSSSSFAATTSDACRLIDANQTFIYPRCITMNVVGAQNTRHFPANYFNILSFGNFMNTVQHKWIYNANLYTTTPANVIAAIDSICANNNPACPTYLELGNEYYRKGFYPTALIPSSTSYINKCKQVFAAVGKYFPNRVVAISDYLGHASSDPANSDVAWNAGVAGQQGQAYNHLSVYLYSLTDTDFPGNPSWSWYTLMLAWPETVIRVTADKHQAQFPNTELWVTEFNYGLAQSSNAAPNANDAPTAFAYNQRGQISHGLNIASYYLSMMAYPTVYTKAWLYTTMREAYLAAFTVNATGYYAYPAGHVYTHLSYIMQTHDNYTYLTMNDVPTIPSGITWWGGFSGTLSALQGVAFASSTKLTYVIINRVKDSVDVTLPTNTGMTILTTSYYNGTAFAGLLGDLSTYYYPFNPSVPPPHIMPWMTYDNKTIAGKTSFTATIRPFGMQVLEFFITQPGTWDTTTTTSTSTSTSTSTGTSTTSSSTSTSTSSSSTSSSSSGDSTSNSTSPTVTSSTSSTISSSSSSTTSASGTTTTGTPSSTTNIQSAASALLMPLFGLAIWSFILFF